MGLADPVFLIPSEDFHKHAAPRRDGAFWKFTFVANMEARTRDHWHPWRVKTLDLGSKLMETIRELQKRDDAREKWAEVIAHQQHRPSVRPRRLKRAA
jgi:hypothetical protein